MKIRTLIVDDEPLGRKLIWKLLTEDPDFEILGECADGAEALQAIRNDSPDLVFLDVQMPELNGFEVLAELPSQRLPMIIFVTAFDTFALKAFEAAARHESFTRAAEELCVTQGAVSHQVKALEAELAIKLFNRERQRLIITEAGRDYLAVVRDALDRLAVGTERLLQRQSAGVLTVSTSPDFAAKWLVHRLGHFAEAHAGIDLRVSATMHHVDFAREDVDMAVRHGDGNWSGLDAVQLSSEQLFAICSPKLLSGRRLGKPAVAARSSSTQ